MLPDVSDAALVQMAWEAVAVDWVTGVCMSCLLYDHLITFGQEVNGMWSTRLSLPKILFFLNRYVVVGMLVFNAITSHLNHLSIPFCDFYLRWLSCTVTVTTAVVEGILLTRIWALFRGNKPILYTALALYIAGTGTEVGLTVTDYVATGRVNAVDDFNVLPGCYAASVPSLIAGSWITPLVVESFMFIVVVSRAISWSRDNGTVPRALRLIARDSAVYYTLIFVMLMANLLMFEFATPFLGSLFVTPLNTVGCILGSRMLLNLRGLTDPTLSTYHSTIPYHSKPARRFHAEVSTEASSAGPWNESKRATEEAGYPAEEVELNNLTPR